MATRYLTVYEYADAVGRSHQRIRALLKQGRIRGARKRGRDWEIPASQVAKFEEIIKPPVRPRTREPREPSRRTPVQRTPELEQLLVRLVNEGASVADAAAKTGIHRVTAYRWLEQLGVQR